MSTSPQGWYQDPYGRAQLRWWDGNAWTTHCTTNGQQFEDAIPGTAPVAATTASQPTFSQPTASQPTTSPPSQPTASLPAAVPAAGAQTAGASRPPLAATQPTRASRGPLVLVLVALGALLAGAIGGYVARGGDDGDGGGGGGGTATTKPSGGTVTTPGNGSGSGSLALPLLQGLSSLNTYEWHVAATTSGETAGDVTVIEATGSSDTENDASYQKQSSTTTSADGESSTSVSETWRVGNLVCTLNPDDDPQYTTEARNPFEFDLGGTMSGVLDLVVATDNAEPAGTETVAGVSAKHYTFTIEGLGAGSGTQVTANEGQLWVAEDGGYLLRYQVKEGMRSAPEGSADAEVFELDLLLELTSVNEPVSIAIPSACPAEPTPTES